MGKGRQRGRQEVKSKSRSVSSAALRDQLIILGLGFCRIIMSFNKRFPHIWVSAFQNSQMWHRTSVHPAKSQRFNKFQFQDSPILPFPSRTVQT